MGDHRATIKISIEFHGVKKEQEFWINWVQEIPSSVVREIGEKMVIHGLSNPEVFDLGKEIKAALDSERTRYEELEMEVETLTNEAHCYKARQFQDAETITRLKTSLKEKEAECASLMRCISGDDLKIDALSQALTQKDAELEVCREALQVALNSITDNDHIQTMRDCVRPVLERALQALHSPAPSKVVETHNKTHKTVIVFYRDGEYEECCDCDWKQHSKVEEGKDE